MIFDLEGECSIICFVSNSASQVEHVVREEKTLAAYDLLEIYCELIAARLPIIESQKYVTFVTICDLQVL